MAQPPSAEQPVRAVAQPPRHRSVWLSTSILTGSLRTRKGLEGTEARSLRIWTLDRDFLLEELADEGLKLLQPGAAVGCLTSCITFGVKRRRNSVRCMQLFADANVPERFS